MKTKLQKFLIYNDKTTCQICYQSFKSSKSLIIHLKFHKISSKEYYNQYFKSNIEGICPICGNSTNYINFLKGYFKYCSRKCCHKDINIINKISQTNIEKYGKDYRIFFSKKTKQTKFEKYGDENYNNIDKIHQTCLEKYGVSTPMESDILKNNFKHTMINKYGVDNIQKLKEFKEKSIETFKRNIQIKRRNDPYLKEYEKYRLDVLSETSKWLDKLWNDWNGRCYYCGNEITKNIHYNHDNYPTIDHKISIYYGFNNNINPKIIGNINNLGICCRIFNSKKGRKSLFEYMMFYANLLLKNNL